MASLAQAAALLQNVQRTTPDRRRFRRASLELSGRILNARGRELDCRTTDVSPGGARLVAAHTPQTGEGVVIYLDVLGRVPARVSRGGAQEDGFGVLFDATLHKREKIAEQLTWLINKDRLGLEAVSRPGRSAGSGACSVLLENGKTLYCDVLDFSMVGASLRTAQKRPEIGAWVRVGQTYGRVARYLENGFAVDFQSSFPKR